MTNPTCETCRWWHLEDSEPPGECHRHAPAPVVYALWTFDNEEANDTRWPETLKTDFCAEHTPRETQDD